MHLLGEARKNIDRGGSRRECKMEANEQSRKSQNKKRSGLVLVQLVEVLTSSQSSVDEIAM